MISISKYLKWGVLVVMLGLFAVTATVHAETDETQTASSKETEKKKIPNKKCLKCHDDEDEKVWELDDGREVFIYVDPEKFEESVHGDQFCVGCHANIELKRGEHEEELPIAVSCVTCHTKIWKEDQERDVPEHERLEVVMEQIDSYMTSVHARPSLDDQTKTNAACQDCHQPHNIGTIGSEAKAENRLKNPEVCGRCHEKELEVYQSSIHGKEVMEKLNAEAAVCSDCHTTHNIESPGQDQIKLAITKSCGDCHEKSFETYMHSYHGQVSRLGYTNTAKCYDCHGSHDLKSVDDPTSLVHLDNRLETCNTCHEDAPEGFLGFHAHGDPTDYEKYPGLYITAKFMTGLIIGVFLFFWTHVILWFYREYRDRQEGKGYYGPTNPKELDEMVYFRRFGPAWRVIHLLFAVCTMTLVLSGSTLLFSHTAWAPVIMDLLGGPEMEAIIHRTAATIWLAVFATHLGIAIYNVYSSGGKFRWFGPTSMIPNWQDLKDVGAMLRWFFGKSERPEFERWTYWQKFDYWAPFWGAAVIGFSGLMLYAPTITAAIFPGFVFNLATIVHAEEALLATVFLFSVHFFNAHFRPDKFPMSTTIFTGVVSLEEYKHEHKLEYERLKASGELDKYLVKRPSKAMVAGTNVLTAILIMFGLLLLTLVISGFISSM